MHTTLFSIRMSDCSTVDVLPIVIQLLSGMLLLAHPAGKGLSDSHMLNPSLARPACRGWDWACATRPF